MAPKADNSRGNLLLRTLTPEALEALEVRDEEHRIAVVLIEADETPKFVYFPYGDSVASIVRATNSGAVVESGVIGSEGVFNIQTVITPPAPTGSQVVVQIDGVFGKVKWRKAQEQFRDNVPFRNVLLAFTSAFVEQVTQNLVCNRLHPIEQRLAKWLLIIRDRTQTDDLHLTQDFVAHMLGVHRPGVSIAMSALEIDGLIEHTRGSIRIREHAGLVLRSCECYASIHANLAQLVVGVTRAA
jgi:Crp-like helix-turn-helix domain